MADLDIELKGGGGVGGDGLDLLYLPGPSPRSATDLDRKRSMLSSQFAIEYHRHPCALDRPSCAAGILGRWISLVTDWWVCMYQFHDTRNHCFSFVKQKCHTSTYLHGLVKVFFRYWRFQHSSQCYKILNVLSYITTITIFESTKGTTFGFSGLGPHVPPPKDAKLQNAIITPEAIIKEISCFNRPFSN